MGAETFAILGISGAVLVALFVEAAKRLFPKMAESPRAMIGLALGIGLLLSVLVHLAQIVPGLDDWLRVVMMGLLAGLSAMGLYDAQKAGRS